MKYKKILAYGSLFLVIFGIVVYVMEYRDIAIIMCLVGSNIALISSLVEK